MEVVPHPQRCGCALHPKLGIRWPHEDRVSSLAGGQRLPRETQALLLAVRRAAAVSYQCPLSQVLAVSDVRKTACLLHPHRGDAQHGQ